MLLWVEPKKKHGVIESYNFVLFFLFRDPKSWYSKLFVLNLSSGRKFN